MAQCVHSAPAGWFYHHLTKAPPYAAPGGVRHVSRIGSAHSPSVAGGGGEAIGGGGGGEVIGGGGGEAFGGGGGEEAGGGGGEAFSGGGGEEAGGGGGEAFGGGGGDATEGGGGGEGTPPTACCKDGGAGWCVLRAAARGSIQNHVQQADPCCHVLTLS